MATRDATASKRKRPSVPVTPAESPTRRRHCGSPAAAAAAPDPKVLVTVEAPDGADWCTALRRAREDGKFVDITLVVNGRKMQAHKTVLVSFSPYIDGLLTSGLAESAAAAGKDCDVVTISDENADGGAVEAIVDCMYSGTIALSRSTVSGVIRTANLLQVGVVEKAACDFFAAALEPETASDALCFAAQFSECGEHARVLHERCLDYVAEHFADCSREPAFAKLPHRTVCKLIARDDLDVDEDVVLLAARAWFEHDTDGRKDSLDELVQLIRWPLLPAAIQLELKGDPLLMNAPQQLVIELLTECFGSFEGSGAAAGCLRLKRRYGIHKQLHSFHMGDDIDGSGKLYTEAEALAHATQMKGCVGFTFDQNHDDIPPDKDGVAWFHRKVLRHDIRKKHRRKQHLYVIVKRCDCNTRAAIARQKRLGASV